MCEDTKDRRMVLFVLVYFASSATGAAAAAATAPAKLPGSNLSASKIEMKPDNTIQYLQFEDLSYNFTDFTICTWIKLSTLSHTQTIFRLTGNNKKETVMAWRMHKHPKETMRVTVKNRLVASENLQLIKGRWSHMCFQWKGLTGVWAMFIDSKVHSVGQTSPIVVGNGSAPLTASILHGTGAGIVGDDGAPCQNGWQVYGLYMAGSSMDAVGGPSSAKSVTSAGGKLVTNAIGKSRTSVVGKSTTTGAGGKTTGKTSSKGKSKNANKRQAVFDSEGDDPVTGTPPPKPFQWLTKSFAFVKRMFTFVIIPFFKFVRNTFFQTRSVDDTVVDVSETHLTVSDMKFTLPPPPINTTTTIGTATDSDVTTTTESSYMTTTASVSLDDFPDIMDVDDNNNNNNKRRSSSSKRETGGDDRCSAARVATDNDRVTAADLLTGVGSVAVASDDAMSPNAGRYLRMVSDGLNDVGVNIAFVRLAFACCKDRLHEHQPNATVIDWDRSRASVHNVTISSHVCGRF